jgi:hypothetical protein
MNTLKYTLQILVCLSLLLAGCSEEIEPKPLTYTQLLSGTTSKTWKLTGWQIVESGKDPQNFNINDPSDPDVCLYDDLYVFYADEGRTFELQQGADKCIEGPDTYFTDTWSLVNATATLNFGIPFFGVGPYTIRRLTEKSMSVEYYFKEYNFSYRFIFTSQND